MRFGDVIAPPVAPRPKSLPFYDPNFSWDTFEGFFCDFLTAAPELIGTDGKPCRVVKTNLYGRQGDSQHGIDIRAEMSNGEIWVFQCKHYKSWGAKDTADAVAKCDYVADRKFLLVTRSVSPESRDIIAKHAEWTLWDSDDISREFLLRLPPAEAAKIVYRNFGPGWSKELLGLPGAGPLITAEAKFAPLLEPGRSFHHRLNMVGRTEWLTALDNFVEEKTRRVFFVIARGGLGKSRLLYEWSKGFSHRHKSWTLRFISDSPSDFGSALDATTKPLVLVFDDAHRLDEVRRALFSELPPRKEIKLVLGLRPGPVSQVEAELTSVGFDTTHFERPTRMKRLNPEQALQLAEAALGAEFADRFRLSLRDLSKDCPLLAVLAAELIKRGELAERGLSDTAEFRNHVFEGLVREAQPVEQRFGAVLVGDLLHLLAVLAPVKLDGNFLGRASAFLEGAAQPNHVSEMIAALDESGLILTTGAGVRISPDLLSDHLAYTSCYDRRGRSTTFADRVTVHFPPDEFPRLMQHLAEAEWHATNKNESADSIVEPVWQAFVRRFESGSFYARAEQLKAWANIAHLQPKRTLRLAELALRFKTAPNDEHARIWSRKWNTHLHVLEALPSLLKPLAEHNREYVGTCLDILWEIGRDLPPPPFNTQNHPISKIGEIAKFQLWKHLAIQDEVLNWIERLLAGNEWVNRANTPGWLLTQMLNPFFATGLEDNWMSGNTFHWRTVPIHLENTAPHRHRVLAALQAIASRGDAALTLAAMSVLEHAMQRAYLGPATVPAKFSERWLTERKKALEVLAQIIREYASPIIHFRARRILLHNMRYEDAEFRTACRKIFEMIPDSLDFRIVRAAVGSYWDEFEGSKRDDWQDQAKQRWDQFIRATAEAIRLKWPEPDALLRNLAERHQELLTLGFQSNFWPVLHNLAEAKPDIALNLATEVISQPANPLGRLFDALVIPITKTDSELRLKLVECAIASDGDDLKFGAIMCFSAWRQEGGLPLKARDLMNTIAGAASPLVADSILRFIWFSHQAADSADWHLLCALPVSREHWWIAHRIMESAADLLEKAILPAPETADQILRKLDVLDSIGDPQMEHAISEFAKHFPGKTFLMMWRRHQRQKNQDPELDVVPFDFHAIRFADVLADPDAARLIGELEDRFLSRAKMEYGEIEILQIALMQAAEDAETNLRRILDKANDAEQVERVGEFVSYWHFWPIVLSCPDFTRELLRKAKATDQNLHQKLFRRLQGLPGSRGSSAYEPNAEWKSLAEAVESMAEQYKQDPELGPLYAAAAKHEREWMKAMSRRLPEEEDVLED
jgi:hypothetical protein